MQYIFWITTAILVIIFMYEYVLPTRLKEGFESGLIPATSSSLWANFARRRGDIGPGFSGDEEAGYIRNPRYFQGYTDVQRLGVDHDFCRVVTEESENGKEDVFIACALAGTDGLSSVSFKTEKVSEGLRVSRDDYMRDVNGDGRADYCRILKTDKLEYQALCRESTDTGFRSDDTVDPNPPARIQKLIDYYNGALWWFRFADDMLDYCDVVAVSKTNNISMPEDEIKRLCDESTDVKVEGLKFDGNQYLRIGEKGDMEFGTQIRMRTLKAFCLWVYVDEFTNNAHIFDFGNGAGKDNIWLGIGKPSEDVAQDMQGRLCESTLPAWPSGPQAPVEQNPREFMKTSDANVDEYECIGTEKENIIVSDKGGRAKPKIPRTADLIYEVWDKTQRCMRIKIPNVFTQGMWIHVALTAKDNDSFRPDIEVYVNGELRRTIPSGFLPQSDFMSRNYIGKSNWSDVTSQYADKDGLFSGRLFDFRGYARPIKPTEIYKWGKEFLGGLQPSQ